MCFSFSKLCLSGPTYVDEVLNELDSYCNETNKRKVFIDKISRVIDPDIEGESWRNW